MDSPRTAGQMRKVASPTRPWLLFLKGFLKHPIMIGSIIPSSQRLVRHMLGPVDWTECRVFVEYGPGVGTFTPHILQRLGPDALYIAIDLNPEFIAHLSSTVTDSRFRAIVGSAADVEHIVRRCGCSHVDYVLSGLPFSTLPNGMGESITAATARILKPGGSFLVYQFRRRVQDYLALQFPHIDHALEYWNIPPCHLFWAKTPTNR